MKEQDREGIAFGFGFVLIWLLLLTSFIAYDRMYTGGKFNQTIMIPPPIQTIEFEPIEIGE